MPYLALVMLFQLTYIIEEVSFNLANFCGFDRTLKNIRLTVHLSAICVTLKSFNTFAMKKTQMVDCYKIHRIILKLHTKFRSLTKSHTNKLVTDLPS